ncbi:PQQ-dependent dehydrogenase, methanol/ethanol family [Spongiibacter tropicus]|uniref:PQQ-dependent dehydrogenase, methanol/ethanol family n=1 Tax=Spongiibacter tropicus TaxID=454602 RepID=UPI0003B77251|nr:PQQ-dependent dehydrogenase, methanol/ethanol family [Spongiibacter tropicus]
MRATLQKSLVGVLSVLSVSTALAMSGGKAQLAAEDDGTNWPSYGRTYKETHYSPLKQINENNIDRMGLVWSYDLPAAPSSGVSAPLAVDGVLYFSVGHSVIHAMDAKTGKLLWQFDPKTAEHAGHKLRAGWGVRGIAYNKGKVFTGTLDGRLIAIDAKTGKQLWSAMTVDPEDGRYITGAPWVMNGKVIIGHGGADYNPVRGYVTAYDEETGKQAWRFYTVPGNPADGFENKAMEMAAKTWSGEWWRFGGTGGTVWGSMTYDKEFNRIYIGVGNGAPWNQKIRSPGGGDNLFLSSIVALDADTGEYIWHYQTNPGESWDFNATMDMVLDEMEVDGKTVPVLYQAPKNGFFYVINRLDGSFISAEKFSRVTWATGIDPKTGRPIEVPEARYPDGKAFLMFPSAWGAHGVAAMSYNPDTGLVYLPARDMANIYTDAESTEDWTYRKGMKINSGLGKPPAGMTVPKGKGWLAAWDPRTQKEVWRVDLEHTHNAGTMTTAGNWVMQGRNSGELSVYKADSGEKIWSFDAQNGIMTHPITYLVDGKQYVTQIVGWRASSDRGSGKAWDYRTQKRRVLTFALDGKAKLPPNTSKPGPIIDLPDFKIDEEKAALGRATYYSTCYVCHGVEVLAGGAAPDLLRSGITTDKNILASVLIEGAMVPAGMPQFEDMTMEEVEGLVHFIRKVARRELAKQEQAQEQKQP